jgi:hypothetical protein
MYLFRGGTWSSHESPTLAKRRQGMPDSKGDRCNLSFLAASASPDWRLFRSPILWPPHPLNARFCSYWPIALCIGCLQALLLMSLCFNYQQRGASNTTNVMGIIESMELKLYEKKAVAPAHQIKLRQLWWALFSFGVLPPIFCRCLLVPAGPTTST